MKRMRKEKNTNNCLNDTEIQKIYDAIEEDKIEEIRKLLKPDRNLENKQEYRYGIIEYAVILNRLEIVELLLQQDMVNTEDELLILIACSYNYKEMTELLIKYKVNINEINIDGSNALYMCVYNKNLELLKILVENGGNIEQVDNKGMNLLYYAVSENCYDIVSYLLEKGMDKYINDEKYLTLMMATHWNYIDIVKLLLENGANVKLKDELGNTALLDSIKNKNFNLIPLLLEHGSDLREKDKEGKEAVELLNEELKTINDIIKK